MALTYEAANQYHELRGNQEWAGASEEARKQALLRASDYVEAVYRPRLIEGAPEDIVNTAVYIIALIELREPNFFSTTQHPSKPNKVLVGVGDIRWQVVQGGNSSYPVSNLVESLLGPYTAAQGPLRLAMFVV